MRLLSALAMALALLVPTGPAGAALFRVEPITVADPDLGTVPIHPTKVRFYRYTEFYEPGPVDIRMTFTTIEPGFFSLSGRFGVRATGTDVISTLTSTDGLLIDFLNGTFEVWNLVPAGDYTMRVFLNATSPSFLSLGLGFSRVDPEDDFVPILAPVPGGLLLLGSALLAGAAGCARSPRRTAASVTRSSRRPSAA
jgi:hypothetical protein